MVTDNLFVRCEIIISREILYFTNQCQVNDKLDLAEFSKISKRENVSMSYDFWFRLTKLSYQISYELSEGEE